MPITAEFLGAITLAATRFPGPKVMLCPRLAVTMNIGFSRKFRAVWGCTFS
jgi:hypothetical protein